MGLENMDHRSLLEPFDHTNGPILGTGGQMGSVRAPSHRPYHPMVGGQGENLPAADDFPRLSHAIQASRCQVLTILAPGQRANQPELLMGPAFVVSVEGLNFFAGGRIPDPDLAVVATRRQPLAVRAPGHGRGPP